MADEKKQPYRGRFFVFTCNNWKDSHVNTLDELVENDYFEYLIYQPEVGEEKGTPHLQGFFVTNKRQLITTVGKKLGKQFFNQPMRSPDPQQAKHYCMKPVAGCQCEHCLKALSHGKQYYGPYKEYGICPVTTQGKRSDLDEVCDMIKAGKTLDQVKEAAMSTYVKYHSGFDKCIASRKPAGRWNPFVIWLHGPSTKGKSYWARNAAERKYPSSVYVKTTPTPWFQGYQGEKCVILDDFRSDWFKVSEFLNLLRDLPCQVQVKGSHAYLVAETIIITTNHSPEDTYQLLDEQEQVLNRLSLIIDFANCQDYNRPPAKRQCIISVSEIDI